MDRWLLIFTVAGLTYFTRVVGFGLGERRIPPALDRFLIFVPIAAFAALIVPGLDLGGGDEVPRVVGLVVATVAILRFGQLWVGLVAGMLAFWLTLISINLLSYENAFGVLNWQV